nr:type VII secretion-associated serine protease mycosin [Kibdelosporangium sp. MJ126-NF4]CEL16302.1 subtilase family protein [Kibdelosporangium sp. MJ126-NF4]CTQ94226.1 subtilase family protein [Kibdelosporangium sp. MJ126-NF4]
MGRRVRLTTLTAVAVLVLGVAPPATAGVDVPKQPNSSANECSPPPVAVAHTIPWAQKRLAPERVWPLTKGAGVTVAVLDTGTDGNVPQLAGAVLPGFDAVAGRGTANDDCFGHGTFVTGIIAARPHPATPFVGIAPEATILPIRSAKDDNGASSQMAAALRAAADRGAKVANISSSATYPSAELEQAVKYAQGRDVLIVAAAANKNTEGNPKPYPASYDGVLAVGAIGRDGARAEFSQTGAFVGLVAPGVDIVSTGTRGPGHWQGPGTSYAAPFVTGVAALVRAYYPKLTAVQVMHRLEVTADHPAAQLPDEQYGWGVVNPYSAIQAVLPEERPGHEIVVTARGPVPITVVQPPDTSARDLLLIGIASATVLISLAVLAARFAPLGRRRRWHPARATRDGS